MMFHERYVDVLDEMCGDIDCSYNNSLLSVMYTFSEPIEIHPERYDYGITYRTDAFKEACDIFNRKMGTNYHIGTRHNVFEPNKQDNDSLSIQPIYYIFSIIELQFNELSDNEAKAYTKEINVVFSENNLPWLLTNGKIIKVDAQQFECDLKAKALAQLQKLSELNQSVENALEKICGYVSMIDTFNESITKYNDETHKLIDTVLESQNSTFVTVQEFAKNITDMTSYVSVVKTSIDELKSLLESFSQNSVELMNANVLTIERTTNETARVVDALDKQVSAFTDSSGNLITEIKTVGSRIHTECNGLESSLSTSLNATFKVFDENLAEITTHLNSSIKEMQELVDRLPRDLYISIGKLKESMDQCVSLLNDNAPAKEGHES